MNDPIHNERYAENLRVEVRYDMEARYEQVIVINVLSGVITGDGFKASGLVSA